MMAARGRGRGEGEGRERGGRGEGEGEGNARRFGGERRVVKGSDEVKGRVRQGAFEASGGEAEPREIREAI